MIELLNKTDFEFEIEPIEKIALHLLKEHDIDKTLELVISDNKYIQNLNREHRGKDSATDVLSFPMLSIDPLAPLGSIVISQEHVADMASELGHTAEQELALLFTHGLLHLLGYDHENDESQMRDIEEEIVSMYNLPKSLIVRNEEIA